MSKLFPLLGLLMSFAAFGQPGVSNVVEIDGKKYYEHRVDEGNTLWGMQRMYDVPYQEIVDANPGFEGLKKGEIILVPAKGLQSSASVQTSEYKVKNKETLYGLSKKFNTTVDELLALNPELSDGLKKGQIIKVPGVVQDEEIDEKPEVIATENPFVVDTVQTDGRTEEVTLTFSDSTIHHVVLAHETMYSISKRFMVSIDELMRINKLKSTSVKEGQILLIPVKSERVDKVEIRQVPDGYDPESSEPLVFESKEQYNVALMLPLHLEYGPGFSEAVSDLATQFYMGAQLALDSLEQKGFRAKVHVYDTRNDSSVINSILGKPEFAAMDLVIGPLLGKNMSQVADYCKMSGVRMVCPVSSDSKLLENNRLVYASVPSDISLMRALARYMLDNYQSDNIILVKPLDKESLPMYEAFRQAFKEMEVKGVRPNLAETTVEGFNTYIRRGTNNRFVVPTNNRSTAIKFMNNLNRSAFRSYKDDIFVYGTNDWVDFTELNDAYKNKYNFHYAGPNFVDYYTEEMVEMNRKYRSLFKTDMSKVAVQAYDVFTFYCSSFFMENDHPFLLMNAMNMHQLSPQDGYENSNVFIVKQEEFELIKVGVSSAQ